MTYLTERQAMHLRDRLLDLPRLAAATVHDGPGGTTVASAAPPGTDLRAVDAGREQPKLLAKLCECVRVVAREEMPASVFDRAPERAEVPTWASETAWLVATIGWWQADDWCAEWVDTEESRIRAALVAIVDANSHYRTCGACGSPIDAHQVGDWAIAQCRSCERIVGGIETGYEQRLEAARNLLRALVRPARAAYTQEATTEA